MNILVYDGPGVSKTSLSFTLSTLRTLLLPNYTVQTISPRSLSTEPWRGNCALLVVPGGRDLPYLQALEKANAGIVEYVRDGGKYLGICAGAYYACRRLEWEVGSDKEVSGSRPLGFFKGVSRGCVYPGFEYESEHGARAVKVRLASDSVVEGLYYNGGGEFVDARQIEGTKVLATYADDDAINEDKAAAVLCTVDKGLAALWAVHPEYPLTLDPALSAVSNSRPELQSRLPELEEKRWVLMRDTLTMLGLSLPGVSLKTMHPLPQYLTSTRAKENDMQTMLDRMAADLVHSEPLILKDAADTFHLHRVLPSEGAPTSADATVRDIIVFQNGALPPAELTREFSISKYYESLGARTASIGEVLMYGEVVTSTQTLLDKNPKLMSYLPSPLVSIATHQLAGRGRGSNIWLSPPGCLQFSLYLRLSLASILPSKLIFIQYLFALAVAEACREPAVLGERFGGNVRVKWPNDIYALTLGGEWKKVGGILVNTSFMGGNVDVVIGHGLNVLSPSPLTSLAQLVPPGISNTEVSMERTAAAIMIHFDRLWTLFLEYKGDFESSGLLDMYLQRWIHSDQLVTLTTVDPPVRARIVGITPDHGLLRTMPEGYGHGHGDFIDLQPDGNSFDLMAGLIKVKT